eukprot:CAMPEP_0118960816 /NCGR_PEP_ID=MMETSP1169-20130426/63830_1 /TAXON_ID=36882 /ORGANISM="Pyramimonas obovata, Strain CCMP722" /LENGTH=88 /DNA_ID=CAMNT_0006908969 /DNA_START=127 /DNA_END=393 /DNA_ORIENTATION=-
MTSACRRMYRASIGCRMFTSGASGNSVNLSQQSPRVWRCASGSQHTSRAHHVHALHGSRENGPCRGAPAGTGWNLRQASSQSCAVAFL